MESLLSTRESIEHSVFVGMMFVEIMSVIVAMNERDENKFSDPLSGQKNTNDKKSNIY